MLFAIISGNIRAGSNPNRKYADSLLKQVQHTANPLVKVKLYIEMIDAFVFLSRDSSQIFFNKAIKQIHTLKTQKQTKEKLKEIEVLEGVALFKIGTVKYSGSLFDSALMYYKKAAVLQEKWQDKQSWSKTLNYMARLYERKGRAKIFYSYITKALHIQHEIKDTNGVCISLIALGDFHRRNSVADSSEYYYAKALQLARESKTPFILSFCLHSQGAFFEEQGRYEDAIANFFEAVKIQEANKIYLGAMKNQVRIAALHIKMNDFEKALLFLSEAEKINAFVKNPSWQEGIYNKYGLLYSKQNKHKKSLEYYKKSLEVTVKWELGEMIKVNCLRQIGIEYRELKEFEKSIEVLKEAYLISLSASSPMGKASTNLELGKSYFSVENLYKAKEHLLEAFKQGQDNHLLSVILSASENLYAIAQKEDNNKSALEYYKVFIAARDSMKMDESEKELIRKEAEYRVNAKNNELFLEKQKVKLMEKDEKLKNYLILILGLATILLFIISTNVYRYFNKRKKATQERIELYLQQINGLQENVRKLLSEEAINPNALIIDKSINKYLETPLSVRELDVLKQLSTGKSNLEISDELSVSVNTVRSHLQKIYEKLEVKNRTQAIKKISDIYLINSEPTAVKT